MRILGCASLLAALIATWSPGIAHADLQSQLSAKRSALQRTQSRQAALSSALERYSGQIDQLSKQVAALRIRKAQVERQLQMKEAQLRRAKAKLARLRKRLHAAMKVLEERLVATYESSQPDALTVILNAHGFNQLTSRYEYLQSIERQDASIVSTVRTLRDEARATVTRIKVARDRLATERDELARTSHELRAKESQLSAARSHKQRALSQAKSNGAHLQSEISAIEAKIQAAQAPTSGLSAATSAPLAGTLGPVPAGQAVSPFPASCPVSWGRTDQGVDGTTTPGCPLLAMGSGTVTIGHDPGGFGTSYPILHTSFGDFYYGHCVPVVGSGASVSIGQPIASAHQGTWGNSTTPGGFEIGAWPPGGMTAGAAIRSWLIGLPRR